VRIFQDLCGKLQNEESTMSEPRTLLVIAGEFPPLKTIGRIRTVKFVDQLRQYGWRSIVITLEPSGTEGITIRR
jgi:hypothetical protein